MAGVADFSDSGGPVHFEGEVFSFNRSVSGIWLCRRSRHDVESVGSVCDPVEAKRIFHKQDCGATSEVSEFSRRTNQVPDQSVQAVLACVFRQQQVLRGDQQILRDLPESIVGTAVCVQSSAGRMVQVQIDEWPFLRVLLPLLSAMPLDRFGQGQRVVAAQDKRVAWKQRGLPKISPGFHDDVRLPAFPHRRLVDDPGRLLNVVDPLTVISAQSFHLPF